MSSLIRVVLDTNIVLSSVSRRSPYRAILQQLFDGKYDLYLTNDILLEYEEKITQIFDRETAETNIGALMLLQNVYKVDTYFQLRLIYHDLDDNKFADCAFAANAHYLVTNDRDFRILKSLPFPKFNVVSIGEFLEIVQHL
ncbi:MAG: putative toxin-antitoxin system toxin component, PIN family [Saprospiraceae bacterium]|nr:putative toxin-antitoxin system toxin component, PIN family [Saprospiraceae bacterium]